MLTVSGLGDRDTTCAIVGGAVALGCKALPAKWLRPREPLETLAGSGVVAAAASDD